MCGCYHWDHFSLISPYTLLICIGMSWSNWFCPFTLFVKVRLRRSRFFYPYTLSVRVMFSWSEYYYPYTLYVRVGLAAVSVYIHTLRLPGFSLAAVKCFCQYTLFVTVPFNCSKWISPYTGFARISLAPASVFIHTLCLLELGLGLGLETLSSGFL